MQPLVDAACDWMFGCCSPDELVYQVGDFTVDANDCSERLLDAISAGVPLNLEQGGLSNDPAEGLLILALSINEGRVDVNSAEVQECADATSDRACNAPLMAADPNATRCMPGDEGEVTEPPCNPDEMFVGKQGVGEECSGQFECAIGLRCIDFGTSAICARRGAVGENCFVDDECDVGLICDWANGTCDEGKKLGEACAFVDPLLPVPGTESIRCAEGLACDPTTTLCVGGYCAPGAPCSDFISDTDCPEGYFCTGDAMGLLYTCQPPGGNGAPCMRDETCASLFCDPTTATCGDLLADGSTCNFSEECASGWCDFGGGGICSPTVPNGQPCPSGDNAQCSDGYCDFMAGTCTGYAAENGPCPTGIECDPTQDLFCVGDVMNMTCQRAPFPNGTNCVDGSQCQTNVCFNGLCADGTPIGSACSSDPMMMIAPCVIGSYCNIVDGSTNGTCVELLRPGQSCQDSQECWGECVVRYGRRMCDSTPAFQLNEVWCDGL